MAVKAAHLLTIVEAKTEEHDRKLKQAGKEVENLAKKDKELAKASGEASKGLTDMGKAAALAFSAATLAAAKKMFDAASDLNETVTKSRVVFGDSARAIEQWASTSARAMGQSRQQAMEAAATYGNLFTSMGITREAAAKMSTQITQLASDLASFNNVPVAQALEAIRSGLVGESEPLRQFGVNLNEATLKAEALRLGLIKSTKEGLEPSSKAAAAYSIILKQTKNAQGDFAETASGAANQQRILTAQFRDAAAALGQNLLPVGNKALQWLNDMLGAFNQMPAATQNFGLAMIGLAAAGGPIAQLIGKLVQLRGAFVSAGLLTAAGKAGIIGTVLAAAFSPHALAALDAFNLNNKAKEQDATLPEWMKKRNRAAEIGDEIADLEGQIRGVRGRQQQRVTSLRNQGFVPAGKIAEAGQFFERQIRTLRGQVDALATERARLEAEANKLLPAWKKAQREDGKPTADGGMGGIDWLSGIPTQTPGADEGALKKKRDAWQRHLEALAALRQRMADRMAQITHNQFERERRELNQFMAELRKAGISAAERRRFFGAVSGDITDRENAFIREGVGEGSAGLSAASSAFSDLFTKTWNRRKEAMKEAAQAAGALGAAMSGLGYATGGISGAAARARADALGARMFGGMTAQSIVGNFSGAVTAPPPGPMDAANNQFTREARSAGRQLLLGLVGRRGENRDLFRQFAGQMRDSLVGVFYDHAGDIWKPLTEGFKDKLKDAISGSVKVAEGGVARMLGMVYQALQAVSRMRKGFNPFAFGAGLAVGLTTGNVGLGFTTYNAADKLMSGDIAGAAFDVGTAYMSGDLKIGGGSGGSSLVDGSQQYSGFRSRGVNVSVNYNGPMYVNERADPERVARHTVNRAVAAVRSGALN